MSAVSAPQVGNTCTVGKGKTRWEIINISDRDVSLSKVGGDGYTNKWAKAAELTNIRPHDPELTTLGQVLTARENLAKATKALDDRARRHGKPEELNRLLKIVTNAAAHYDDQWTRHNEGR